MDRLLKKSEFARLFDVSEKTVDEWRKAGRIVEGRDYLLTPGGSTRYFSPLHREQIAREESAREEARREAEERIRDVNVARIAQRRRFRDAHLRRAYGISVDDYDALLAAQNECCAICETPADAPYDLVVDHDHSSGMIRGLLCGACNNGLGLFRDNTESIGRARKYLVSPPFRPTPPVTA